MRQLITVVIFSATALSPHFAAADNTGRNLAAPCAICHGTEGRAVGDAVATLAGLPTDHFVTQMRAFREGKRQATVMHQIAKGYTDAQIDSIAKWYAAQKR